MKQISKKFYLLIPLLFIAIINSSCGEKNPAAPSTATITVNPEKREWTVGATVSPQWFPEYLTIVVYEDAAKTKPMSDIKITISCTLANPANDFVIQFYHDGERVNSPLTVKTDSYGTYILRYDLILGGYSYKVPIEVRSGTVLARADIEVKIED
jgi:hypothetical protein